jgi:hypothetical protein
MRLRKGRGEGIGGEKKGVVGRGRKKNKQRRK